MNDVNNFEELAEFKTDRNVISEFLPDTSGAADGGETVREGTKEAEKHPDHLWRKVCNIYTESEISVAQLRPAGLVLWPGPISALCNRTYLR